MQPYNAPGRPGLFEDTDTHRLVCASPREMKTARKPGLRLEPGVENHTTACWACALTDGDAELGRSYFGKSQAIRERLHCSAQANRAGIQGRLRT